MTDKEQERVRTLIGAWRVEHDRQTGILEELETLLTGGVGIAEKLKDAEGAYVELYSARYRSAYVWSYAKDRPQMKRLIKLLGLEELKARMGRYLQNSDTFFTSRRHPFGLFVHSIVQFAGEAATVGDLELSAPVADCKHAPACRTDQEHTRKRSAEMRA